MSSNQVDETTHQFQVRLPTSLKDSLEEEAKSQFRSQSSIIREALSHFLEGEQHGQA